MQEIFNSSVLLDFFKPIINSCPLWAGKKLSVTFIVNPYAGGFTVKTRANTHIEALKQAFRTVENRTPCVASSTFHVTETEYAGHGAIIAEEVIISAEKEILEATSSKFSEMDKKVSKTNVSDSDFQYLIIIAGGDGTGLEVQSALVKLAVGDVRKKNLIAKHITVLRLPLGTGNDGSDGRTLNDSLRRLLEPAHFSLSRIVKVTYDGELNHDKNADGGIDQLPPWYSFNLASVGIDAFVTHMTNKMKRHFPGDSYKLWIDIACLFYNIKFPAGNFDVQVLDAQGNILQTIAEKGEFCLLAVSGHRTYGSGQLILPTDENFCMARKMSILQKLMMKKQFTTGKHFGNPLAYFKKAEKIIINYDKNLLVQMDGEAHLLHPEQFPLIMERSAPLIRIIENDDSTIDKGAIRI